MADINLEDLNLFDIQSAEDALLVIHEFEEEVIKLGRRIRNRIERGELFPQELLMDQAKKLGSMLQEAFQVDSLADYTKAAAIYGEELAGALYGVQERFGGLQIAIIQAVAPLVQLLLPVVEAVISALTGLAQSIGSVLRMLFLGSEDAEELNGQLTGTLSTATKLKKTLAGFDQLNRLGDNTGISISVPSVKPLSGEWEKFAKKLAELFDPLKDIDLTPAAESLERLRKALEPITKELFSALEWAWYNIFVPLAEWAVEELLPVFLDTLTASLEALARVIEELKPAFLWLWENYLKPLAQWKADELIDYLKGIGDTMNETSGIMFSFSNPISQMIQSGNNLVETLAGLASKALRFHEVSQWATSSFTDFVQTAILSRGYLSGVSTSADALVGVFAQMGTIFDIVGEKSNAAWGAIQGVWSNAWSFLQENLSDPAEEGVKDMANAIIGSVNGMLQGVTKGVNSIAQAMNKLSFTLPDWLPGIGGKGILFSFPGISLPQIPLLAKGAVLPANQPFMAVVGDQKHGTNIEAPLSTIQEAVALVMEDYSSANMAGHQATVAVLQQLLSAVLGIHIGDDTIAAAVNRYEQKMAVVTGGYL